MTPTQEHSRQVPGLIPPVALVSAETPKQETRFKQGSILRYRIDIISVAVVVATVTLQFIAYYQAWPWYLLPVIMLGVRAVHFIDHNHTHLRIFRQTFLNEILGYMIFISNGVPVEGYEMQHVRNHHRFVEQWGGDKGNDWSSSFGFEGCRYPDKPVNLFYYSLTFVPLAAMHTLIEFIRMPGTPIFWSFLRSIIVVFTASALMIARDPWNWFLFFGLPVLIVWANLGYANRAQHVGCDREDPYAAANVNLRFPARLLSFNMGFHVEHHMKPTLHWSLLPKFHEINKSRIPAKNYVLPRFGKIKQ